jgi:Tfp pilus assembly protein PilZ
MLMHQASACPWWFSGGSELTDGIEKRRHPRIPVRWPVTIITDKGTIEGESRNITIAGVFIHCQEEIHENEVHQMIIKIPKQESILVKGRVVWSNFDSMEESNNYRGMGFSFIKISEDDRVILADVISRHTKSPKSDEPQEGQEEKEE